MTTKCERISATELEKYISQGVHRATEAREIAMQEIGEGEIDQVAGGALPLRVIIAGGIRVDQLSAINAVNAVSYT